MNYRDDLYLLLLFSGPPGAGKSTMAQIMSRDHGYVYYEADCFFMFVNPFVDPNIEEPTLMMSGQKPLKVIIQYSSMYCAFWLFFDIFRD